MCVHRDSPGIQHLFPTLDVSYLVAAIAEAVTAALWIFFMRNVPEGEPMPEPEPGYEVH